MNVNDFNGRLYEAPYDLTRRATVNGVGVFPLIPLIIGGSALLGAGVFGYKLGAPQIDPKTGQRIPGVVEVATKEISGGVKNAILLATVLGVGYMIFLGETNRRHFRR